VESYNQGNESRRNGKDVSSSYSCQQTELLNGTSKQALVNLNEVALTVSKFIQFCHNK
jgi:hypothetical protein